MKALTDLVAAARSGPAFSNGTEWELWQAHWCLRCQQPDEVLYNETMEGSGCPLVMVMLDEKIPAEWVKGDDIHDYTCTEFVAGG